MYLVDTNVISDLRKLAANRADRRIPRWFGTLAYHELHVSVTSLVELELGIFGWTAAMLFR